MERFLRLISKKRNRIILFVILDILILSLVSVLSIYLRFDLKSVPQNYLINAYKYLPIDILIMLVVFIMFRLYVSVWTYASVLELINVGIACSVYECTKFLYRKFFEISMPRSYYVIEVLLLIFFVAMVRFSYRIVRALIIKFQGRKSGVRTLVIGAGQAARMLLDEVDNNKVGFNNNIICIVDDDKNKKGTYIKGIPVLGTRKEIEDICSKYNIDEIIIAIPSASKKKISLIVEECQKTKCKIKILPTISKLMDEDSNLIEQVRPLSYEDFLGRDQIVVDSLEIADSIKEKTVMVTGGGGSIGSELCRQIAKCEPKELIIFDIYENNAYDIEQELRRSYPELNLKAIIGSVRDYDRLETVFKEYSPQIVFHAAAHKHVPLMEVSPNEAIKNNCLGTLNTAKLADIYKVDKFVLISTDKAVRPTNVMGATKRICEMIIQTMSKESKHTDYVAVRFGNVLGSNGSVIPLFLRQIDEGGPVTVTHKEITRFFMTIPEAVSLVLQASVYAKGGEIFVLDMGKPVKIYDLAKKLIKYRGLEPGVDIEIKITGLRPGEKLYEEILMDEEGLKETPNKLIHIGKPIRIQKDFMDNLDKLIKYSYKNKSDIKEKLAELVTTYKIDKRDE